MRKPLSLFILIALLLLQACSALDFIPSPAPANTSTPVPSQTASNTPTITQTPTRTTTPRPRNTATLIISEFNTPVVLVSDVAVTAAIFTPTPITPTGGFESVELTQGSIYYGACKQNYTKLTIKVEHPEDVRKVYIFFRLESGKKPGDTTQWYGSVTDNDGGGYFRYTLWANNIPERRNFLKAWVHYQFVAEDAQGEIIGRTQVYTRNLVLEPCK
jgi:hypothetical protein